MAEPIALHADGVAKDSPKPEPVPCMSRLKLFTDGGEFQHIKCGDPANRLCLSESSDRQFSALRQKAV